MTTLTLKASCFENVLLLSVMKLETKFLEITLINNTDSCMKNYLKCENIIKVRRENLEKDGRT